MSGSVRVYAGYVRFRPFREEDRFILMGMSTAARILVGVRRFSCASACNAVRGPHS